MVASAIAFLESVEKKLNFLSICAVIMRLKNLCQLIPSFFTFMSPAPVFAEPLLISDKEKQVLYTLSLNARESISQIAKQLNLSRQVVSYTMEALEKKGIIEGYYAILNINRLGYLYHRVLIKFNNIDLDKEKHIIAYCCQHQKVVCIMQHQGTWDLAVIILAKHTVDFEQVLDDILEKFGDCISKKAFSVSTTIHHLKHKYLLEQNSQSDLVLEGEPLEAKIDEIDFEILGMLTKDARLSFSQMGQSLSLNPNVVKARIAKLHQKQIILGYHLKLNDQLLGYTRFKAFLYLNQSSRQSLHNLIAYLKDLPSTIYITRAIGIADLEFEVYVKTNFEFHYMIKKMRSDHPNLIGDYETVAISYEPYINYLPIKN